MMMIIVYSFRPKNQTGEVLERSFHLEHSYWQPLGSLTKRC
ncbi:unnamed protein product [Brassica oleracea var. botrytis]